MTSSTKSTFKPMLAASATTEQINNLKFPLMASPKLDGIRAIVIDGVVYSRSLKPIRSELVQQMFGKPEFNGFDGELILGEPNDPKCFNNSTALMASKLRDDVKHLTPKFFVFDLIPGRSDEVAIKRFEELVSLKPELDGLDVTVVPQYVVQNLQELLDYEKECLDAGYEGVMVKDPQGLYKQGRSTLKQNILTKVKRFLDSEAIVIGFEEKRTNIGEREKDAFGYSKTSQKKDDFVLADTLGALVVRDIETGIEFSIGSGFDDATRKALWLDRENLKDKIVKYKHFSVGVKEAPRFPTFLGFRDADDM